MESKVREKIPIREGLFQMPSLPSETPYLIGSRCRKCQEVMFPQRPICPNCFGKEVEQVRLSSRGRLFTFTINHQGSKEFSTPYASGYVDLPEGVRIYSLLTDWEAKGLKIGTEMELVIEKIKEDREGKIVLGYKFRPV
jgi:benzoylsuccinyl-CoA thiolase BbsA subunit